MKSQRGAKTFAYHCIFDQSILEIHFLKFPKFFILVFYGYTTFVSPPWYILGTSNFCSLSLRPGLFP